MTFFGSSSPYFGQSSSSGEGGFADPFNDAATQQMPTTMKSALWWSEYIWLINGTFRMSMKRVLSYFLTDIEISGEAGDSEKKNYKDKLNDDLGIMSFLSLALEDRLAYGNSFISVLLPFRRYLICPKTGNMYPLSVVYNKPQFGFEFTGDFEFVATCPETGWRGPWIVEDKPREEAEQVILKRWNVHEIEILHDMFTDQVAYLWRIPETYKRTIRDGNLFHLERVPLQVLKAIKEDKLFRFNDGVVFHLKAPTLAGVRNLGWGLPASLNNFRQIWYLQVLRRYNEAIALDYVIPFRLLTPEPRNGSSGAGVSMNDPMASFHGGDLNSMFRQMLTKRRKDPASFHFLPFPVKYQMLGADAKQLAPTELIEQGYDTLLNESGVPVEFYKGSLTVQAAPVALRLFESTHRQLVSETNACLQWLVDTLAKIMSWEPVKCSLARVTLADDLDKQMAALQLMMGQQLSGTSGLKAIGYNWEDEQKLIGEEAIKQQQIQARVQEEAEQAGFAAEIARGNNPANPAMQQQGQPAAGGDPNAQGGPAMAQQGGMPVTDYIQSMGPNANVTPADLQQAAEMLATELLGLPESVKDSQLRELKKSNETLHSLVRTKMDQMRQQFKTQGGAMLMQQQQGQPPA
jgi:hypothetical protein